MEIRRRDGSVIAVDVVGEPDAALVLFCHGLADSRLSVHWFGQAAAELGLRILAPDRPGTGGSGPYQLGRLADWAEDAVLILDAVGAGTAALLYARDLARGYIAGSLGGLVIGAACGLSAVGVSNLLGDHPDRFLPYGVMICALIGAIGGLFGQYAAWFRDFISSMRE